MPVLPRPHLDLCRSLSLSLGFSLLRDLQNSIRHPNSSLFKATNSEQWSLRMLAAVAAA